MKFNNLVDKDGKVIEIDDKYGYLQNIESLRKIGELARNSGKRLRKIVEEEKKKYLGL